jgi:pyruvate-ferredoxin/flavodoxin oxidoreductase
MELQEIVESAWSAPLQALRNKVSIATQNVSDILTLEVLRTSGHHEAELERSLGSFAGASLDLGAVSKVFGKNAKKAALDSSTYSRVQALHQQLSVWNIDFESRIPSCKVIAISDLPGIEKQAVEHLNQMAECLKLIRMAWLERNSKYDPAVHDSYFADFNWEKLTNDEVGLCPPFVVMIKDQGDKNLFYSTLLPLVTSGLPVKVVLEKSAFYNTYQAFSRSTALRCSLEIEMLPVALKGVYVIQDTVARPQAIAHLQAGLISPRPGLFSILNDADSGRCDQAVLSRALPLFRYDPDKSEVFLKRFDLAENPDLKDVWASSTIEFLNAAGKKDLMQKKITFADFAATEAQYQSDFSDLPANQESRAIEISAYLELPYADRSGKLPFIFFRNSQNALVKKVPSMRIVAQTADKRHLWKSLCEVSGVNNPYLTELEKQLRTEAAKDKESALADLRNDLSSEIEALNQEAVQQAMAKLAGNLAGLSALELGQIAVAPQDKTNPFKMVSAPIASKIQAPVVNFDTPYIESKLCTACDECITIDPNIFAYDSNKQAFIKNAKGGPYKNLLKASKKCSAKIIHPGKEW